MQPEYLPPSATLTEPRSQPRSSIVAVLLGGLVVDTVGTIVTAILAALIVTAVVMGRGGGDTEVKAALESFTFLASTFVVGALLVVAGGYVAARWARHRPIAHAVAAGVLALVLGLPFLLLPGALEQLGNMEMGFMVLGMVAQVPLAALGGHLASRRLATR